MPRRRSAPTYLIQRRGKWHYRYRMVVRHRGVERERWVLELSKTATDYQTSLESVRDHREKIRQELLKEIDDALDRAEADERVTLGQVLDYYLRFKEDEGHRTDVVKYQLEIIGAGLGRDTPIDELKAFKVRSWLNELQEERSAAAKAREGKGPRRPLGDAGKRTYLVNLQAALNLAERDDLIDVNPIRKLRMAKPPRPAPQVLSVPQMRCLLGALTDFEAAQAAQETERRQKALGVGKPSQVPIRGIVLCGYYTMARPANRLQLRWEEVDLVAGVTSFAKTKNFRHGVTRVEVPLWHGWERWARANHPGPGAKGWVFPNPGTEQPFSDIRKAWAALLELANVRLAKAGLEPIPLTFPFKNLRHTGATHLAATGLYPPIQIAQWMGDPRVQTVQETYFGSVADRIRGGLQRTRPEDLFLEVEADLTWPEDASKDVSNEPLKRAQSAQAFDTSGPTN